MSEVLFEVMPDGGFKRVEVHQDDGSTTSIWLSDQKENVAIPEQRFHFSPPPGVETIEAEQLGN